MEKKLIGFIDSSLIEDGNEEALSRAIDALDERIDEDEARIELEDHAMNFEV